MWKFVLITAIAASLLLATSADTDSGDQCGDNIDSGDQCEDNTDSGDQCGDNTDSGDQSGDNTDSGDQCEDNTDSGDQCGDNTDSGDQSGDNTDSGDQCEDNTDSVDQCGDNDCPEGQEYSTCPDASCGPLTCAEAGFEKKNCGTSDPCPGKPGCVCKDGYLKDCDGKCIKSSDCKPQCDDGEIYSSCPPDCCDAEYCPNNRNAPQSCPVPKKCPKKGRCVCGFNSHRDRKSGKCISTRDCPPFACKKRNEVYDSCPPVCPGQNCSDYLNNATCPKYRIGIVVPCKPACRCKPGYYRNDKGDCVSGQQCKDDCPEGQEYSTCPAAFCGPLTCAEAGFDKKNCGTSDPCPGKPGCICKDGYLKDCNGKCIKPSDCPSCGDDDNAIPGCSNYCGRTCDDIGKTGGACPRFCKENGCACKPNYYYDNNKNKCVEASKCTPTCGVNEIYSNCSNGLCQLQNCTQYGAPIPFCPRFNMTRCTGGCVCKIKHLRNPEGTCVPQDECPYYLCPRIKHEVYSNCTNGGNQIRNCSQLGKPITCTNTDPADCIRGCICEKGYLRADDGTCVREKDCAPTCGVNEIYSNCSNGLCQLQNCTQYGAPIPFCFRFNMTRCTGGCVCKIKYLRNPEGTCVPQDECPYYLCPRIKHEVYSNCTNGGNQIRNCSQLGKPITCTNTDPADCIRGCICEKGYLRADDGTCVREKDCASTSTNTTTPGTCSVDEVLQLLQQGIAAFTGNFLYESYKSTPNSNGIMSPMSVFWPMAKLALQANGATYTQLMKVLNLRSKDDIRCVFPAFTRQLTSEQEVVLSVADRAFFSIQYPLDPTFVNEMYSIFGAEPESLNFQNATAAADRINEWVANQTHDLIQDIASPEMFNSDTRLVLANAIYFLGNWVNQFNPNNTESRPFNTSSTTSVEVPTMYQESHYNYAEVSNLDCKILEMFYEGGNFSFVIFLPNSVDGLPNLIEKLQNPSVFDTAYNSTTNQKVQAYVPKIKTESEFNLVDILKKAGIYDLFDSSKSNLTGILLQYEPLYVSAAKQKAFCEVNETGTKAAAANIFVGATATYMPLPTPVYIFDANHPFVFYILHKSEILFCGTFVKPNE